MGEPPNLGKQYCSKEIAEAVVTDWLCDSAPMHVAKELVARATQSLRMVKMQVCARHVCRVGLRPYSCLI